MDALNNKWVYFVTLVSSTVFAVNLIGLAVRKSQHKNFAVEKKFQCSHRP